MSGKPRALTTIELAILQQDQPDRDLARQQIAIIESAATEFACGHSFPFLHRVRDMLVAGQFVRLVRCVSCGEKYYLVPIDAGVAALDEPGVPEWLSGEALRKWAEDEDASPEEGPVDWNRYKS